MTEQEFQIDFNATSKSMDSTESLKKDATKPNLAE